MGWFFVCQITNYSFLDGRETVPICFLEIHARSGSVNPGQNVTLIETWTFLGSGVTRSELITPKVAGVDTLVPGFPKSGRFIRLNASPRRSILYFSLTVKSLYRAKSTLISLGPITFGIVLDASPYVYGAGIEKAAVLNHSERLGLATVSETPVTTLGRFDDVTLFDADSDRVCPL